MPFTLLDLLFGFGAPALVGVVVAALTQTLTSDESGNRFAASWALAGGFVLGYRLLALGPWIPDSHWHWLAYAVLFSAVLGPVSRAGGVRLAERCLLYATCALLAGTYLVPSWEDLNPSRGVYLVGWTAFVAVCASLLDPLTKRFAGRVLPLVLTFALIVEAVVLALAGSLRFAQIAGCGAGGMAGYALVACFYPQRDCCRGVALPFMVLSGGAMLVGYLNSFSDVPSASYLLTPIAPLFLWAAATGPLFRLQGFKRAIIVVALPLLPCVCAILLAVLSG